MRKSINPIEQLRSAGAAAKAAAAKANLPTLGALRALVAEVAASRNPALLGEITASLPRPFGEDPVFVQELLEEVRKQGRIVFSVEQVGEGAWTIVVWPATPGPPPDPRTQYVSG